MGVMGSLVELYIRQNNVLKEVTIMLRGVRGATTIDINVREMIMERVAELLVAMVAENGINKEDVGAVIFSSTPDLNSAFPAAAARIMGWSEVPLFGTQEADIDFGLSLCVRILILWNTDKLQHEMKHVYLRGAAVLRPDIAKSVQ
ncbi:MAG: aroH [Firmicutes bacterium]|nr:aroH [Bacillota bacterium]